MAVAPGKAALLELNRVTVMRGERAALHEVSLRIEAGEHAGAVPVEEFFANALEYGKGKRGRSCVEVIGALDGAFCGGGAHDGLILSVVVSRRGPGSSPLCI